MFDENQTKASEYEIKGHVEPCILRYMELANRSGKPLKPVVTWCIDGNPIQPEDLNVKDA